MHHKKIQGAFLQLCLNQQNSSQIYGQTSTIQDTIFSKHSQNSCHIFYLHNIIQFAKQCNKYVSIIFDEDKFCQYSFLTKIGSKSFSNPYTLHMYQYLICDTMLTIYISFYSGKSNLSTFFH